MQRGHVGDETAAKSRKWRFILAWLWIILFPFPLFVMYLIVALGNDAGTLFKQVGIVDLFLLYPACLSLALLIGAVSGFLHPSSRLVFLPVPFVLITAGALLVYLSWLF